MSRWRSDQIEQEAASFDPACLGRRCSDDAQEDDRHREFAICRRSFIFRIINFAALCALAFICCSAEISRAQQPDFGVYARAVEYCRGVVKRPMAFDLDKRVLCFDGMILPDRDISLADDLVEKGLFVVRSFGGDARAAMALADVLRDRRATVVAYDYCLSACASFLLVASAEAFVMKDTVVAWHNAVAPLCPSLVVSRDDGPKRFEKVFCPDSPPEYQRSWGEFLQRQKQFFETRAVNPPLDWPPESFPIRKILRSMFEGAGMEPYVLWTWHPRYYAGSIKTKISYEAYPESQAELDAMTLKLGIPRIRILYDP